MGLVEIVAAILVGVFLYWLRCRARFWYGVIEIVVAITVISLTFYPAYVFLAADGPHSVLAELLARAVNILVSVYILVRGLDNVGQDLPPKWRGPWDRAFPKRGGGLGGSRTSRAKD